jgi:hypothetical protein
MFSTASPSSREGEGYLSDVHPYTETTDGAIKLEKVGRGSATGWSEEELCAAPPEIGRRGEGETKVWVNGRGGEKMGGNEVADMDKMNRQESERSSAVFEVV